MLYLAEAIFDGQREKQWLGFAGELRTSKNHSLQLDKVCREKGEAILS